MSTDPKTDEAAANATSTAAQQAASTGAGAPKYKRAKKLIDKSLQLKLVGVFTIIGCTCALFQIVLINFGLLEIAKSAPGGATEILSKARGMMATNIVWTLGALVPLMTCIGIVLTHRVAGPAYRMTQFCNEIADGGPVRKCVIRKDDELQDLCEALNRAVATLAPSTDEGEDHSSEWALEETPAIVRSTQGEPLPHDSEPAAS